MKFLHIFLVIFFLSILIGCTISKNTKSIVTTFGVVFYEINGQRYYVSDETVTSIGNEYGKIKVSNGIGPKVYEIPGISPSEAVALKVGNTIIQLKSTDSVKIIY